MSSVTRNFKTNTRLAYPSAVVALTYDDNNVVPFTFNKSNGVLDFDFSGSCSVSTIISADNTAYVQGASFSAIHMVNDIGPNIVAWCEGPRVGADVGTVKILEKPIVVRTNQIAVGRTPNSDNTMTESDTPFDFDNASGSAANNFNATYLFRKPMVVTYTIASVRKFRMFNTQFEGNT